MIQIFEIENDKVVPNIECHTIPELKAVLKKYKDPIPALCYLYYKVVPTSAYAHLEDYEKEQVLLQDFAGEYSLEDEVIIKAEEKLLKLTNTPTRKFFQNAKKGLATLGNYMAVTEITEGVHGNFSTFANSLTKIGKIMEEFKKLEKIYIDETKNDLRGDQELSFDE